MPGLEILEDNINDDNSIPKLLARQNDESSSGSSINLLADQKDLEDEDEISDAKEGAKFIIELEQKILDDVLNAHEKVEETNEKKIANKEQEQDESEDDKTDETTLCIEKERKIMEGILDREVKEIEEIHLHNPNVHQSETYEEFDFDMQAALAIQSQLDKRGAKMETEWKEKRIRTDKKWDQKRKAIEQQCKEAIE